VPVRRSDLVSVGVCGCFINHLAFGVTRGSINWVWALCTLCHAACLRRYAVVTSAEGGWSWGDACCTDVLLRCENKMWVSCRVTLSRRVIYFRRFEPVLSLRFKDPLRFFETSGISNPNAVHLPRQRQVLQSHSTYVSGASL
jgi:hypothetical protein